MDSDEQARRAFLGLNDSISNSLTLAFDGYDAASSANIPAQSGSGSASGTITVSGKVDQGNPQQASMSLSVLLDDYSDGPFAVDTKGDTITVTYNSGSGANTPALSLKLNASSGSSIDGSLMGDYHTSGALTGTVTLDVTISGTFSGSGTAVERVPGTTTVMGTVVNSSGGTFDVNAML